MLFAVVLSLLAAQWSECSFPKTEGPGFVPGEYLKILIDLMSQDLHHLYVIDLFLLLFIPAGE